MSKPFDENKSLKNILLELGCLYEIEEDDKLIIYMIAIYKNQDIKKLKIQFGDQINDDNIDNFKFSMLYYYNKHDNIIKLIIEDLSQNFNQIILKKYSSFVYANNYFYNILVYYNNYVYTIYINYQKYNYDNTFIILVNNNLYENLFDIVNKYKVILKCDFYTNKKNSSFYDYLKIISNKNVYFYIDINNDDIDNNNCDNIFLKYFDDKILDDEHLNIINKLLI